MGTFSIWILKSVPDVLLNTTPEFGNEKTSGDGPVSDARVSEMSETSCAASGDQQDTPEIKSQEELEVSGAGLCS